AEDGIRDFHVTGVQTCALPISPLRERKGDIALLVQHILHKLSVETGGAPIRISDHALNQLVTYDFPGNVRELENLLQRASALAEDRKSVVLGKEGRTRWTEYS